MILFIYKIIHNFLFFLYQNYSGIIDACMPTGKLKLKYQMLNSFRAKYVCTAAIDVSCSGAQEALHNWGVGHNNLRIHLYGEELYVSME